MRRVLAGGSSPVMSFSSPAQDGAGRRSESCTIFRHEFRRRATPDHYRAEAAEIIALAFPGPSEAAICRRASRALGVTDNTIRSILRRETANPSWPLLRAAMHHIRDPWASPAIQRFVAGVLATAGEP